MAEANLLDVAHEATPYEDVVCVGLFQRQASAPRRELPMWSLLVVTESRIHILAVRPVVPYITVTEPRLFASLYRSTTVARVDNGVLTLTDISGRQYRFDTSTGQGEYVIKELQAA